MRYLNQEEIQIVTKKLSEYLSEEHIKYLLQREENSFVYYVSEVIAKIAGNVGRDELCHAGTCFGKFTKTKKFRLHITCLDFLAKYAKNRIWLKQNGEQAFLYGNHVIKAHLAKMSENIPQYAGVVVFSLNEVPLGFGVAARSTLQCKEIDTTAVVVFNQADLGEYLRIEDEKN